MSAFSIPPVNLHKITAIAGGLALLVGVAVLLTEGGFGYPATSFSAAVICADGACEATSTNLTLEIADGNLAVGSSSLLSWSAENLVLGGGDSIVCFGKDSGSPCGTTWGAFGQTASYVEGGFTAFQIGSKTYVTVPNYDNAYPTRIYEWMTSIGGRASLGLPAGTNVVNGRTYLVRDWQLDPGAVVTHIGFYARNAGTVPVKIGRLDSGTTYTIVRSQDCTAAIGWNDCQLTTPYTVPVSGTYLVGVHAASSLIERAQNGNVLARSYNGNNVAQDTSASFTQDTGELPLVRVKYQSAVAGVCTGDGTYCNSPVQTFLPGTNYVRGGFSHFNLGGEDYLAAAEVGSASKIYKWMPTISGRQTPGVGAVWSNGYTYIEKGWQLDPGATVTSLGAYYTTAQTIYMKIAKYNSAGNYDIVVSQSCSHPGTGWYDCALSTPYTVPSSGAYYVSTYGATGVFYYSVGGYSVSATKLTHICATAPCTGQSGFTEQASYSPVVRATYQSAVTSNCFGDGNKVCGNPFQTFTSGASNVAGGFTPFTISNVQYLAAGNNGDTSKIYKWMSSIYNGTLTNGPTQTTGTIGGALSFDGVDDYVVLPTTVPVTSALGSVSLWVKTNKVYTDQGHLFYGSPVATGNGSGSDLEFHVNFATSSQLQFFIEGGTTDVIFNSPLTYNDNTWHHVVATWDINGQAILYVDGASVRSATHDASSFAASSVLYIGKPANSTTRYYNGAIDDVRVYNRALSPSEVSTLYSQQSVSSGLVAYWTFNSADISGTAALDTGGAAPGCFGSGAVCGSALQTFATGASYQEGGWEYFQIGTDHYLAAANYYSDNSRIYKWQPAQECFGNGTTCGTALQTITPIATNANYGGWTYFNISGDDYLLEGNYYYSNDTPRVFKWVPSQNCFGDGTTCGTVLQTLPSGYYLAGGFEHFVVDGEHYFAGGAYYNGPRTSPIYKWTPSGSGCPSGGGLGDGITCGAQFQLFPATAVGYSLGGWEYLQSGTDHYLFGSNYQDTSKIFKLNAVTCFGNGVACNTPLQTLSGITVSQNGWEELKIGADTYALAVNGSSLKIYDIDSSGFTLRQDISLPNALRIGVAPSSPLGDLVVVGQSGSSLSSVFKWTTSGSGCPAGGGLGNGTNCTAPLTTISGDGDHGESAIHTVGSDIYLTRGRGGDGVPIYLYKWVPGSSCFGNGTSCGSGVYYQVFAGSGADSRAQLELFEVSGEPVLWSMNGEDAGSGGKVYRWTTAGSAPCGTGGGWGDGASGCDAPYQSVSGSYELNGEVLEVHDEIYGAVLRSGINNVHGFAFKWTYSGTGCGAIGGWGDGTACSGSFQNVFRGNASRDAAGITVGSDDYVTHTDGSGSTLYKWTPAGGASCPAGGGWGDGVACYTAALATFAGDSSTAFFSEGSNVFLAFDETIYKYSSGSASACTLYKYDATNGTTTVASADTATDLDTGALTETTTYTLTCDTEEGEESAALTVTVGGATLSVSSPDAQAAEAASNTGTYTFVRIPGSTSALTVNYTMSGTATNGTDYTLLPGSIIIPANEQSVTLTLTPIDDASYEGSETAILTPIAGSGYTFTPPAATVTITDNETSNQVPTLTSGMLSATPNPVRRNETVTISYNVTGLILENTCTISATPSAALSPALSNPGGVTTWQGSAPSDPITSQTILTLRCLAPDGTTQSSVQHTVNLIPTIQEI